GLVAGLPGEGDELDVRDDAANFGRAGCCLARIAERGEREDPSSRPASHRSSLLSANAALNRDLTLAEHNVENGGAVRGHVPPHRFVAGHLEVEVERRRDVAMGDVEVVVTVLVGVRAVGLAAARPDDDTNSLARAPGL